ncbi:MAG TPA: phosphoribosylamine--glycine ligase [Acidimicrobiaceae bacterium]|nr:phosphoribosylamine--glycine ligase [Acidimicrobiaceae bacterium]MDP7258879.1 phosphoribosylamine--glycine ligase [Acidimicrobiales bacterium]HCV36568.1 phosphoribosylamine--glycine ligase [Acidimicrobiaceae bacterium]HJO80206.1 phosphoribosylamine--glycine ligase [Acidimicrobiales bacterium]
MQVCVVGSGGREHALASVLSRSAEVIVTPGNPGIPGSVVTPAEEVDADLFIIGPEQPLVDGLADRLRQRGNLVFGPGADGARLEGSKAWMKGLLAEAGVPTARHGAFTDEASALAYLDQMEDLFVIKTDGLAAGKGVLVTGDRSVATEAVGEYLSGTAFGDAGRRVVIEEGLSGPELSVLAVCDGKSAVPLVPAQDFKRLGDGDVGPNTGGMGAFSPVSIATTDVVDSLMEDAVLPTLATLRSRGIDYRGVLYCGLMFTPDGPKVLEYNVRFGDPETQVVVPRFTSDLVDLLASAAAGSISESPTFDDGATVGVVCASQDYPRSPRTGDPIEGLDAVAAVEGVMVFNAGVGEVGGRLVTAGGRVLTVTGRGPTVTDAKERAYRAVAEISWPGMQHRTDIADAATSVATTG